MLALNKRKIKEEIKAVTRCALILLKAVDSVIRS